MKKTSIALLLILISIGILFSGCTQTAKTDDKKTNADATVSDDEAAKETSLEGLTNAEKQALAEEELPDLSDLNSLDIETPEIGSFEISNPFPETANYGK